MTKKLLFVILFILGSIVSGFAQQNELLKSDLGKAFRNSNITRLNKNDAMRRAKSSQNITVSTSNKDFELSLTPRDLRAARYYAEDETVVGKRRMEKMPVTTYKGKIAGDTNSEVRLTIDEKGVSGFFGSKHERFYIEPAKKYSDFASADEYVVYQAEDVLLDKSFNCPQDLTEEIADGQQWVSANSVTTLKTVEMATEADYEFVQSASGAAGANAKILSILNMVEGVYERDLNLTLSVVYQHTWSTQDSFETQTPRADPNCSSTIGKILCNFQDYWNANLPATQIQRDAAHLFSYKASIRAQGFAFVGVVCRNANFAYGVSGRVDTSWGWEEANNLITAHEIGHNFNANHSDSMSNCANSLMNAQLSGSTQFAFCSASQGEVNNFVSANGVCLTARSALNWMDFDGDGKTDVSIFRPSVGEWWINSSSTTQTTAAQFGLSTDKVTSGDFTGDGKTDIAFFRPSNGFWFVLRSEDNSFFSFPFGMAGDVPMPADYDGDGKTDATVFRPATSTWYINRSNGTGAYIAQFGSVGDVPVAADYDGDGKADIAIYRPASGQWWLNRSTAGVTAFPFGNSADKPVQGDFTGDGKADAAIYRPSNGNWYVLRSEDGSFFSFPFGTLGDVPSPGDYDGDGKFDAAVFRPSTATWYINRSTAGIAILGFGATTDLPVPSAFVR